MKDIRAGKYQERHQCRFLGSLGTGVGQDGFVMRSDRVSAVKFFDRKERFSRELEVYLLLEKRGISEIAGHAVPRFIESDEELMAIEMEIVDPPFVLDFAGAKRPHEVPDFDPEIIEEHMEHLRELFDDRWTDALHVAEMFRQKTGFVLLDIHPGNIAFAD
jgi:hypothetical protein